MTDFGQGIFAQGFVRPSVPGREAARQRRRQAAGGAAGAPARRARGGREEGRDRQGLGGRHRGQVAARHRRRDPPSCASQGNCCSLRRPWRCSRCSSRCRWPRWRSTRSPRAAGVRPRVRAAGVLAVARRQPAADAGRGDGVDARRRRGRAAPVATARAAAHAAVVRHRAAAHLLRPDRRVRLHPRLRSGRVRHPAPRARGLRHRGHRQGAVHAGRPRVRVVVLPDPARGDGHPAGAGQLRPRAARRRRVARRDALRRPSGR